MNHMKLLLLYLAVTVANIYTSDLSTNTTLKNLQIQISKELQELIKLKNSTQQFPKIQAIDTLIKNIYKKMSEKIKKIHEKALTKEQTITEIKKIKIEFNQQLESLRKEREQKMVALQPLIKTRQQKITQLEQKIQPLRKKLEKPILLEKPLS